MGKANEAEQTSEMKPSVHISAASCVFPAGPGLTLAGAALQVGQALNRLHPFYVDAMGQRVSCAWFSEPGTFDVARWQALAQAALMDLAPHVPRLDAGRRERRHHLLLVLPAQERAGVPADVVRCVRQVCEAGPLQWASVRMLRGGHAAGVQALQQVVREMAPLYHADPLASFVVLAVDSWLHPDALQWLEQEGLLHGSRKPYRGRAHINAYGRVPSEGAAALWLSRTPGLCQVAGVGLAQEPVLRGQDRPTTGAGWTQAAQQALMQATTDPQNKQERQIHTVWSDLNGEPYRADQFGFTGLRLSRQLRDGWTGISPATVSGDLGSASAVAHMALAAQAIRGTQQRHLLLSASDDALRGAVVLADG